MPRGKKIEEKKVKKIDKAEKIEEVESHLKQEEEEVQERIVERIVEKPAPMPPPEPVAPPPFQIVRGRQTFLQGLTDGSFFMVDKGLFVRRILLVDGVHVQGIRIEGRAITPLEEFTMGEHTLVDAVQIV